MDQQECGPSDSSVASDGHTIADTARGEVLLSLGYRLAANKKNTEGNSHEDRDAHLPR
jgi:hypothetical protein